MGDYQRSIEDCKVTLDLNPWHFATASGMGSCYLQTGDLEAAVAAFETAVAINPRLTDTKWQIANLKKTIQKDRQ